MKKIALISLGCAKNLVDSEVMLGYLADNGYSFVSRPENADIILINTCGFIQPAKNEAVDSIQMALGLKKKKGDIKVIVSGCYMERNSAELKHRFPDVDGWIGVNDFDKVVQTVEGKTYEKAASSFLYDHLSPRFQSTPAGWAYVKISEGCSHSCSFCTIPLIKGPYRSRSISSIVQEVEKLAETGVKEINLISQDSTYYGRDLNLNDGLSMLLEKLVEIKPITWVRILYGYPEEVTNRLLEVMQDDKICSYLDIPFQHSDPGIIKHMRRGLDGDRALKLIRKIRDKLPDVAIRTSLIVGFPGEDLSEFENLEHFVRKAKFNHLGVFTYSLEQGTKSFTLGDPIETNEKERRRERIMYIQTEISYLINGRFLNRSLDVLVEGHLEQDRSVLIGRTQFQAPEVDGVVFIDSQDRDKEKINSIQKVEINSRDIYDLYGVFKT
ncbi:30S ribosomal protein S12 methylthiotransferase RimO [Acidobacteriota bacterium]